MDSDTKRLLELTTNDDNTNRTDAVDEIINIIQLKSPKLLDGLSETNKQNIALACQVKLYAYDDVVFNQGDAPDAYYTVLRGTVSIYVKHNDTDTSQNGGGDNDDAHQSRNSYGKFITTLSPSDSFGELSFNADGDHSVRNAGVVSDGRHGEARVVRKQSPATKDEIDVSDSCVLLIIPEKCYMDEMFARDSAKHQTKDKLNLLKGSPPFQHWSMDQLVKLAYAMKKKSFEKGSVIVQQGDRMENLWIIQEGRVRISHNVIPPSSIDTIQQGIRNGGRKQPKEPITVDVANLGANDAIGLVESIEESITLKKSNRNAIAMVATEVFFVPLSFFKPFLKDSRTHAVVEQVAERRITWETLRRDYAIKFPKMSMKLPKDVESMSKYSMCRKSSLKVVNKKPLAKPEESTSLTRSRQSKGNHVLVKENMRETRRKTLDSLANEAGITT